MWKKVYRILSTCIHKCGQFFSGHGSVKKRQNFKEIRAKMTSGFIFFFPTSNWTVCLITIKEKYMQSKAA